MILIIFNCGFSANCAFPLQENIWELSELNTFKPRKKRQYRPHHWSNKSLKGTVMNRVLSSLNLRSREIKFTSYRPLKDCIRWRNSHQKLKIGEEGKTMILIIFISFLRLVIVHETYNNKHILFSHNEKTRR